MTTHPELEQEQAYLDHAYACIEQARAAALRLRTLTEVGQGGTHQARYERDVIEETVRSRLAQLELTRQALVFGRIDQAVGEGAGPGGAPLSESFHIGRLAVSDEHQEPVVVDWRAPVAEPFYRATGRNPMGLLRRRHFSVRGRTITAMEDELFGEGHLGIGADDGLAEGFELRGHSTLLEALERNRTGTLGDIVATIQAEQDEIIRSPQAGVLVVQGGPGTGKTVVALHRAAYLLYTFRFPLEDQGLLVVGPNRLFLRYIAQVLPSLGEAGVEQVVTTDLVPDVRFGGVDAPLAARVKGQARMAPVVAKAVRDRQRPLKQDLKVPFGVTYLTLRAAESERIVTAARRRFRRHNAARRFVETEVFEALAATARDEVSAELVRERTRHTDEVRAALERMWPVLTPAQLLHDLFGSRPLLRLAAGTRLDDDEIEALYRPRAAELGDVEWSEADAALLDEALAVLGPRPGKGGRIAEEDEIRTYGHIVVDEAQDLSPMQLRMVARRSLNGSMTVVGDIAQATGHDAPDAWDDVLAHLPDRRPARVVELSVGYRIPGTVMDLAGRVLAAAAPRLRPPRSVRPGDHAPSVHAAAGRGLAAALLEGVREAGARVGDGSIAVVAPTSLVARVSDALGAAGVAHGVAPGAGLDQRVTVVPVGLVKGLELDAAVVVEPARIVAEQAQGLRALYVALTRPTKHLGLVHDEPLPPPLVG